MNNMGNDLIKGKIPKALKNEVLEIISNTLETNNIQEDVDFLSQGGNSIQAIRITMKLKELGIEIQPKDLLKAEKLTSLFEEQIPNDYHSTGIEVSKKSDIDVYSEVIEGNKVTASKSAIFDIFKEILAIGNVHLDLGFVEQSGDSIKAIRIAGKLRDIGVQIDIQQLLHCESLRDLSVFKENSAEVSKLESDEAIKSRLSQSSDKNILLSKTTTIKKDESKEHWQSLLGDFENHIDFDYLKISRKKNLATDYQKVSKKVSANDLVIMKQIAANHQVSERTIITAIWALVLHTYHFVDDAIFGVVDFSISNNTEQSVALSRKSMPVRVKKDEQTTFSDMLSVLQKQILESEGYDTTLPIAQEFIETILIFSQQQVTNIEDVLGQTAYKVGLTVVEEADLTFTLTYQSEQYDVADMQKILATVDYLVRNLMIQQDKKLKAINMVSPQEMANLNKRISQVKKGIPNQVIPQVVTKIAETLPTQPAIRFNGMTTTYEELNSQANAIAQSLLQRGLQPGQVVGIFLDKSATTIAVMLGVMKAGGACLTIDIQQPIDRVHYMLEDADARFLVIAHDTDKIIFPTKNVLDLRQIDLYENVSEVCIPNSIDQLAYIIYTSGSTGNPKGSLTTYRGLMNLADYMHGKLGIGTNDVMQQFASLSFDASVWEIFTGLVNGATIAIVPEDARYDPALLVDFWNEESVTFALVPPALMNFIPVEEVRTLRYMVNGGESADPHMAYQWSQKTIYINAYGPSESTIVTTMWLADKLTEVPEIAPIGQGIQNTEVYILNGDELVADGMPGELCIGGIGLSEGYYNRDELNQEKFVQLPQITSSKLYRSGDLCRRLPNGEIIFLGRIDDQVKIHGYRIEVGEIEKNIRQLSGIYDVVVKDEKQGENHFLAAYVVMDSDKMVKGVKASLAKNLPHYMIPERFILLDKIPMTVNGKVDRKKLTEILVADQTTGSEKIMEMEEVATAMPTNTSSTEITTVEEELEVASILVNSIVEVLGQNAVDMHQTFLEIGGDSISALRVVHLCKQQKLEVPITVLVSKKTIAEVVNAISGHMLLAKTPPKIVSERENEAVSQTKDTAANQVDCKVSGAFGKLIYEDNSVDLSAYKVLSDVYKRNIHQLKPIDVYDGSFIQFIMGNEASTSGHIVSIEGQYTPKEIETAVLKIIRNQGVLRSTFTRKGLGVTIKEYPMTNDWKIPFTDLRDEQSERVAEIFKDEQLLFFDADLFKPGNLSSDIHLYQISATEYRLFVRVHHLFWDAKSSEILEKMLFSYLTSDGAEYSQQILPYREYVSMLKQDQKEKNSNKLLKRYMDIGNYLTSARKYAYRGGLKKRGYHSTLRIKMSPESQSRLYNDTWGIMSYITVLLNQQLYLSKDNEADFPLIFLHHGREGKVKLFENTMGLFLDIVPMAIYKDSVSDMNRQIDSKIENYKKLREKSTITFPEYIRKKKAFHHVLKILGTPMLNFLGFFSIGNSHQEEGYETEKLPFKTLDKELIMRFAGEVLEIEIFATEDETKRIYGVLCEALGHLEDR